MIASSPSVENDASVLGRPSSPRWCPGRTRSGVAAHQVREHAEEHAAEHDDEQRERQRESRRGAGIQPGGERARAPGMAAQRSAGPARGAHRGRGRPPRAGRPAPGQHATAQAVAIAVATKSSRVTGMPELGSRSSRVVVPADRGGKPHGRGDAFDFGRVPSGTSPGSTGAGRPRRGSSRPLRDRMRGRHPAAVFFAAVLAGFALLGLVSIALGLLVTDVLLHSGGIARDDESVVKSIVAERTPFLTDASAVGSTLGGAPLLPILVGLIAIACACCASGGSRRSRSSRWSSSRPPTGSPRSSCRASDRTSSGWRTCPPTPATRPVTRRRRSRSTSASCC